MKHCCGAKVLAAAWEQQRTFAALQQASAGVTAYLWGSQWNWRGSGHVLPLCNPMTLGRRSCTHVWRCSWRWDTTAMRQNCRGQNVSCPRI